MPSPSSSAPDRRPRDGTPRAFTLIELVVVLALLGLIAALVAGSVGAGSDRAARRDALRSLVTLLTTQRLECLRGARSGGLSVTAEGTILDVSTAIEPGGPGAVPPVRQLRAPGMVMYDSTGAAARRLEARFDAWGRTPERRWMFLMPVLPGASADRGRAPEPAPGRLDPDRPVPADRIWLIEFDPVSGAARLVQAPGASPDRRTEAR